jgi:5-methylcytosine-specific restriction protein A
MLREISNTLSGGFFPTKQFNDDFSNGAFLELKRLLEKVAENVGEAFPSESYSCNAYIGMGKIAYCPWIGLHSKERNVDSRPESGVYVTILWKCDGTGVCLSLQKGSDKSSVPSIRKTVASIRSRISIDGFDTDIDLKGGRTGRPRRYEMSNIASKSYKMGTIFELPEDLRRMEELYRDYLAEAKILMEAREAEELTEASYQGTGRIGKVPIHSEKWERDSNVKEKALKLSGYKCEVDPSHKTFKTKGHQFTEGHHLVPMGAQKRFNQSLDFVENIVSLCPNCHRKIHMAEPDVRLDMANRLFSKRREQIIARLGPEVSKLFDSFYVD